jgi:hypothetical protein
VIVKRDPSGMVAWKKKTSRAPSAVSTRRPRGERGDDEIAEGRHAGGDVLRGGVHHVERRAPRVVLGQDAHEAAARLVCGAVDVGEDADPPRPRRPSRARRRSRRPRSARARGRSLRRPRSGAPRFARDPLPGRRRTRDPRDRRSPPGRRASRGIAETRTGGARDRPACARRATSRRDRPSLHVEALVHEVTRACW